MNTPTENRYSEIFTTILGSSFQVSLPEIECYRNNFQPILELNSVSTVAGCIKKLKYIS